MGFGKFWRRDESGAGGTRPVAEDAVAERAAAERAAAEDAVWEWFAAGLAWTLFTLPEDGVLILTDEGDTGRFTQFSRGGGVRAELGSAAVNDRESLEGESVLAQRGWGRPDHDEVNWHRDLPWPARYSEYEELADAVVWALRHVARIWLPLGLVIETWNDENGPVPEVNELATFGLAAEQLRSMTPRSLRELADVGLRKLGQTKLIESGTQEKKRIIARAIAESEGWSLLTGDREHQPVRDRTIDFVALAAPDHLVAFDVYFDVEAAGDVRLDNRIIEGRREARGTAAFVEAAVRADPDLASAFSARGLLTAFHDRRVRLDYQLVTLNSAHDISRFAVACSGEQPVPTPPATEPPPADVRSYPLLKPADWPHRGLVHHRETGPSAAPVAVVAEDQQGQYAVVVDSPGSVDFPQRWDAAVANLRALHYDWEIGEVAKIPLANCSGHDFSAEKVLDPDALRVAHRFLNAPRLWVAAPRRTCLMAAPSTLDRTRAAAFRILIRATYDDDSYGHAPITPGVYVVEDGHVVDFIDDLEILDTISDQP